MKVKRILVSQPKPESGKSPYYDLAEKYNVSSGALSVNQAGILRAGAGRLTDAAAALRAMDGRLLR